MNFIPFLAESDSGGGVAVLIVIIVVFALIKNASKPKGKWVYVEQKKGCLLFLVGGIGLLASAGISLVVWLS
jgi:hypothetical protein